MIQNFTIRKPEKEDLPALIALCKEHAIFEGSTYEAKNKEELLSKYLFQAETFLQCLVVEHQETLVGYVSFMKQFSTWDAAFYTYLDCLYLKEATRGQGLGRKLMEHVKDYALQEQCIHIQWQTPKSNINAVKFYQKLGAISKEKERFFWGLKK